MRGPVYIGARPGRRCLRRVSRCLGAVPRRLRAVPRSLGTIAGLRGVSLYRRPVARHLLAGAGEQLGRDESRCLGRVHGDVALGVSFPFVAGSRVADRVVGVAQVDRLGPEHRALGGQRSAGAVSHVAERGNGHDVARQVRRQRTAPADAADRHAGHDVHHRRALGVTAQHDLGVRALRHRLLDAIDRVVGAVTTMQLQLAGGVIHPVGVDVQAAGLLAQRVDEGVAHLAESGRFVGASREDNLDVRAVVGGRHR